jgi:hypothetical protein
MNITALELAPYLWYVHAHCRLPPFYPSDGRALVVRPWNELRDDERAACAAADAEGKPLPDSAFRTARTSDWADLPFDAGDPTQVDQQFFLSLASDILARVAKARDEARA